MADLSCAMENQETSKPDLTSRTLLDAAEKALMFEGGKLHIKDLQEKMVEYGLIPHSAKSLASLESILYRETFNDNSKFQRIEGHLGWFALMGFDDMESGGSSSEEDQSEGMDVVDTPPKLKLSKTAHCPDYKNKYYALKKVVKELVFLNAATSDDIARTDAKLSRAKAERKCFLKRLVQYQAATEAGVLQTQGLMAFDHSIPDFPTNIPKQGKTKVKKQVSRSKEEKGNLSKSKSVLHKKLTQAKLAVQAKNMAKLAGQYHRAPLKTSQSKVTDKIKDAVSSGTQEPVLPESDEVSKDKKTDKTRSSRPKVKKAKPSESPQNSSSAAATTASPKTEDAEAAKPKRKKPGTAIKRKVQPIPVDSKGKPVFPIVLGGLTVHSLGEIVSDRPGFHSERYIWPVGYCSSRTYPSMKEPDKKCIYTCKILDGGFGPQFEMCPEDDPDHPINASSATACHCVVLKALNKARGRDASNTGSGPEFFGYSHPTIQYLIQNLTGSRKCSKYQWVKFELPKPQSKQVAYSAPGGKLSSVCTLNLDSQESPCHETTQHLSSSSSQEDTGVGDESTLEHHDSNLTLHSSAITDNEDDLFEDIDIPTSLRPLTLESSNTTLSEQIGDDIGTDIDPLMSSSASAAFSTSLPMTLSPPSLTSPSCTVAGNGSFMMPLTSPLFSSTSGFPSSDLTDLPKQ